MYEIFQVFTINDKIGGSRFFSRTVTPTGRIFPTKEEAENHLPDPRYHAKEYKYFVAPQGTKFND